MAVVFDNKSTQFTANPGTSLSDTSLTIGSGTNRALLLLLSRSNNEASLTCTWGGVSLTKLANVSNGFDETTEIWGLLNPASGAQTLAVTWLNPQACCAAGISFTGVEQSSLAAAFTNANNSVGATGPATLTITSAVGDFAVACQASGFCTLTEDNISIYSFTAASGFGCSANRATGAATVTLSATQSAAQTWASSGVNIHAAASTQLRAPHIPKLVSKQYAQVFLPYNQALYSVAPQAPFFQTLRGNSFFPETPSLGSPPLNINLFTNPIPFGPFDLSESVRFPLVPQVSQPYNQSLYTVTITLMGQAWI